MVSGRDPGPTEEFKVLNFKMFFLSTATGIVIVLKMVLHNYIDFRNGRDSFSGGALIPSPAVFWFYRRQVSDETLSLKKICNVLYGIFLCLVLIMTIKANI